MSATRPAPTPAVRSPRSLNRTAVLTAVLDPRRLPTPPAVALQVVNAASRSDCDPAEIVALISQDPTLCAKLLKAVNSCLYGLSRPIASLERAVTVLGLGPVRSLALGLSMPAMRAGPSDPDTRNYQITSVAGAIIARDLSARTPRSSPDDDLVAGLLRDIGAVLLQQTFPDAWRDMTARWGDRLLAQACEAEEETFGISHAEVSAELLAIWKIPEEIVEPIRYHHNPERLATAPKALGRRAELLYFAGLLASLDTVVRHPAVLEYVLEVARTQYNLPKPKLINFMRGIVPKIMEFGELLNRDVRDCPNFADALSAGGQELVNLAVATNRTRMSGDVPVPQQRALPQPQETLYEGPPTTRITPFGGPGSNPRHRTAPALPEFRPTFLQEFPVSGCQLGEYELREVLGRGAMGVVFKAFEPSLARFVAIKMLSPNTSTDQHARERFAREARAGAAIRHENVVTIYAVREVAGLPYLAMEYVEGVALDRYADQNYPVPVPTITRIAAQIALGLSAAHKKGIIHRDIKPANIILENGTGTVKIADFGLARSGNDANLSQTGAIIGTPYFMSPEQIQGQAATVLSDLYSLGGVLYTMCTGQPPFTGKALAAVLYAVCNVAPLLPRQHRPDLPQWLEEIVMSLLDKNPTRRIQSAAEVAAALTARTS